MIKRLLLIATANVLVALACAGSGQITAQPPTPAQPTAAPPAADTAIVKQETEPAELSTEAASTSEPAGAFNPAPPGQTVKLIFLHHSSGENWLSDQNGELGLALMKNNYFVSDTNYDWGPDDPALGGPVGSYTDIGNWWNWFLSPNRDGVLEAVFNESEQHAEYSRLPDDPGGENEIIMFKSCFPNSALSGSPEDPPQAGGNNLLFGLDASSEHHTVANVKGIYIELLRYFAGRPDKLFVVITAPPLHEQHTQPEQAAAARALNRWLVDEWRRNYPLNNVAVFDFYNVLTSNGGDPETNDIDAETGNHHRFRNGQVEYVTDRSSDYSAYATPDDDHPTAAGNLKATAEFAPLLNIMYHQWRED